MFKKIWDYLIGHRDIIYIFIVCVVSLFLIGQCNRSSNLNREVQRLENNILALTDTLTQYVDDRGWYIGEKHAFQLTEKELRDSVDLLKIKNREYLTYINTHLGVRDTLEIPTYIDRPAQIDTIYYVDQGTIRFDKSDKFDKSSREVHVSIPYTFDTSLKTGNASFDMYHDIYVESMIERDKKTNETFVRLISDYPGLVFNSGMGVVVTNSNSYEKSMRKTRGIGLSVGPNVGMSYDFMNRRFVPTVGIGVTIGFNYTPKWLQW